LLSDSQKDILELIEEPKSVANSQKKPKSASVVSPVKSKANQPGSGNKTKLKAPV